MFKNNIKELEYTACRIKRAPLGSADSTSSRESYYSYTDRGGEECLIAVEHVWPIFRYKIVQQDEKKYLLTVFTSEQYQISVNYGIFCPPKAEVNTTPIDEIKRTITTNNVTYQKNVPGKLVCTPCTKEQLQEILPIVLRYAHPTQKQIEFFESEAKTLVDFFKTDWTGEKRSREAMTESVSDDLGLASKLALLTDENDNIEQSDSASSTTELEVTVTF